MAIDLDDIRRPIQYELDQFEIHFKQSMKSQVPLLDKITSYIIKSKGKQIRPMFVFLSAKIFGPPNEGTYIAASLVELLHTASLVHDDVVDDASERRGFFSINALWKNKIAVLVGDFLLSRGLQVALDNDQVELLRIMSQAVQEMSEGELLQMEKARRLDIKEDIYFEIIRKKTATLIAASCKLGAASVTQDAESINLMYALGQNIGICFQIKDDLFDYGDDDIGKPRGIDIKEQKMTLPLIYTLQNASRSDRKRIINIVKRDHKDPAKVREVIAFVKASGGLEYATKVMYDYYEKSKGQLEQLPDNEARNTLLALLDFTINRRK